ncbi:MAG: hypothetical protein RMH74_07155, partial [Candidatus Caldarchaeum sp.]|nr:hypothetical protein [Candidatus Caldarchaeum sp.]
MTAAAYVRLTRPPNSLMMFFAVVVGAVASNISSLSADKLLLALATAYGLTGSSMILNDYFDREVDAVN